MAINDNNTCGMDMSTRRQRLGVSEIMKLVREHPGTVVLLKCDPPEDFQFWFAPRFPLAISKSGGWNATPLILITMENGTRFANSSEKHRPRIAVLMCRDCSTSDIPRSATGCGSVCGS